MTRKLLAAAAIAAIAITGTAVANDSTAEMTAGGLVLRNSRNIDMLDEDLFVSADLIRVNYVFKNQSRQDQRVIVAFPLPDRDLNAENESDVGHVRDFHTEVDGRAVEMQVERKAFLGTVDHTARLTRLGIPIAPEVMDPNRTYAEDYVDPTRAAIQRLTRDQELELQRLGLVEREGNDYIRLLWTVKETYYWTQTFPAGRELRIQHRYVPGTGGSVGALLSSEDLRNTPDGRQYVRDYCADAAFIAGADRLRREAGENGIPSEQRFGYILTTGANWRAPIRNFRLVVDKGDARNIVSFCGQNVRRISPTQFEVRHQNWRPTRDLKVLIIRPYAPYTGD